MMDFMDWEPEVPGQFNTPLRIRRKRTAAEASSSIIASNAERPTPTTTDYPTDCEFEIPSLVYTPLRNHRKRAAADAGFPDTILDADGHIPVTVVQSLVPKSYSLAPITNILVATFRIVLKLFSATVRGAGAARNSVQVAGSRHIIEIRRIVANGFESVKRRAIDPGIARPVTLTAQQVTRSTRLASPTRPSKIPRHRTGKPQMTSPQEPSVEQLSSPSETSAKQIPCPEVQIPQPPMDRKALGAKLLANFTPPPIPGAKGSLFLAQKSTTPSFSELSREPNSSSSDMSAMEQLTIEKMASRKHHKVLPSSSDKVDQSHRSNPLHKVPPACRELPSPSTKMRNSTSCLQNRRSMPSLAASEMQEPPTRSFSASEAPRRVRFAINPTNGLPQERSVKFYKESKVGEWAPSSPWAEDQALASTSDLKSNLESLLSQDSWILPPSAPILDRIRTYSSSIALGKDIDHSLSTIDRQAVLGRSSLTREDRGHDLVEDRNCSDGVAVDRVSNGPMREPSESVRSEDSDSISQKEEDSQDAEIVAAISQLEMSGYMREKLGRRRKEREEAAEAMKAAAAKAKAEAEEAERRSRSHRRMPKEKLVRPLSKEWEAKIQEALSKGDHVPLTTTVTGTELRRKDFMTVLGEREWLNDEIINAYLEWIVEYANKKAGRNGRNAIPKVIAHNSFFYKNLATQGPQSVSRWMKRKKAEGKKLLEVETVLIPVNNASHWTIIVVSPQNRTIEYLDSFSGASKVFINHTKAWLAAELGSDWHEEEWQVLDTRSAKQQNGYDCGVFTITNAECVTGGIVTDSYDWSDMSRQRCRIAAVLLNRGFGGEFVPAEEL